MPRKVKSSPNLRLLPRPDIGAGSAALGGGMPLPDPTAYLDGALALDPQATSTPFPNNRVFQMAFGRQPEPPLEQEDALKLAREIHEYWSPLRSRQQEDLEILCGLWGAGVPISFGIETDGDPDLPSVQFIPLIRNKFVSVISGAGVSLKIDGTSPDNDALVERGRAAWKQAEREWARRHARASGSAWEVTETEDACDRGWIAQRLWWDEQRYQNGECAVDVQQADPATVSPQWGATGELRYVVQTYASTRAEVASRFPELADRDLPELELGDTSDAIDMLVLYDVDHVYYFVDGHYADTITHGWGRVPWLVIATRGYVRPTGQAFDVTTGAGMNRGVGKVLNAPYGLQRYAGLSCFHEAKGVVRNLIELMKTANDQLKLGLRPIVKVKNAAGDKSQIEIEWKPGAEIELAEHDDIEALEWDTRLQHFEHLIQFFMTQMDRILPAAAWGPSPGVTSALDRSYVSTSLMNVFQPYVRARELAAELRWDFLCYLYSLNARGNQPMQFGMETVEGQSSYSSLDDQEFKALMKADVTVGLRDLLPQEAQMRMGIASMNFRNGLWDRLRALEYMGEEHPRKIIRRIDADSLMKQPLYAMTVAREGAEREYPERKPLIDLVLPIELRRAYLDTLSHLAQSVAQHRQATMMASGQLPMPPPGGGPPHGPGAGPPTPPSGGAAPSGGPPTSPLLPTGGPPGQAGVGPPPGASPPAGPAMPAAIGEPGVASLMGGGVGLPGGSNGPGVGPELMSPAALGQAGTPDQMNPVVEMIRALEQQQAQLNPPERPY
jgi:hypothetical protein